MSFLADPLEKHFFVLHYSLNAAFPTLGFKNSHALKSGRTNQFSTRIETQMNNKF